MMSVEKYLQKGIMDRFSSSLSFAYAHKKIGNIGINANFVFPRNCSFLLYWHQKMLLNVKLDISLHKSILFHGSSLHWSS